VAAPDLSAEPAAHADERLRVGDRVLLAVSDGVFRMPRDFLGDAHDHLVAAHGSATLPIGAFALPGETTTLIDLGIGPRNFEGKGVLEGGRLLTGLAGHGIGPGDVDLIALSHLHADHVGWLATAEGEPVFPRARVAVGREDWTWFVEGERLEPHLAAAFATLERDERVELLDGDRQIAPGVTRLHAPGHTPGHSLYAVHDAGERAVLLGDAVYCPLQLAHPDWEAMTDLDPALARRTREAALRAIDHDGSLTVGCHFPGLRAGRIAGGHWTG
jgi:glyoxylase-like metal-dependent hydrolase (beta-lactamase superfamily II)